MIKNVCGLFSSYDIGLVFNASRKDGVMKETHR